MFDNKGTVIRRFEALKEHGKVNCVDVFKNQLYLAQEKQIVCISNFNTRKEAKLIFIPKINSIFGIAVANDNILICTDNREGIVYEYSTADDSTKMVLQGLRRPSYISVDHTPQGTRYILTWERKFVNIYNESWQLLTTIIHGIKRPCDSVPCPGGFLLADNGNNKITLYSYNGDIVRTVLTEKEGVMYPICLTLQPPYIWVTEVFEGIHLQYNGKIKCFKLLK